MKTSARTLLMGVALALAADLTMAARPAKPPPAPTVGGMDIFAAGTAIGKLVDFGNGDLAWAISSKGYAFIISKRYGFLAGAGNLYFAGSGCTGEAYMDFLGEGERRDWLLAQGIVYPTPLLQVGAFYVPRGSSLQSRAYASRYGSSCVDIMGVADMAVALPNNPDVTGVTGSQYPLPIVLGIP